MRATIKHLAIRHSHYDTIAMSDMKHWSVSRCYKSTTFDSSFSGYKIRGAPIIAVRTSSFFSSKRIAQLDLSYSRSHSYFTWRSKWEHQLNTSRWLLSVTIFRVGILSSQAPAGVKCFTAYLFQRATADLDRAIEAYVKISYFGGHNESKRKRSLPKRTFPGRHRLWSKSFRQYHSNIA